MRDYTQEELDRKGFESLATSSSNEPPKYMRFIDPQTKTMLTMSHIDEGIYFPHTAIDINGDSYSENDLLYDITETFETVEGLLGFLNNPTLIRSVRRREKALEELDSEEGQFYPN